jgi:hypothetical protein
MTLRRRQPRGRFHQNPYHPAPGSESPLQLEVASSARPIGAAHPDSLFVENKRGIVIDIKEAARVLADSQSAEKASTADLARRRRSRRVVGAAGTGIALAAAITVGAALAEHPHPTHTVHVGTTQRSVKLRATGARGEAIRLLDAATLPPKAERVTKAPVTLLTTGIHGSCDRQVDLARFWVVKQESPLSVARFLEHHIPARMTGGGAGLGTDADPDTYTFIVFPKGQLANLNELYFTVTTVGVASAAVRADGIGIPRNASCYIK